VCQDSWGNDVVLLKGKHGITVQPSYNVGNSWRGMLTSKELVLEVIFVSNSSMFSRLFVWVWVTDQGAVGLYFFESFLWRRVKIEEHSFAKYDYRPLVLRRRECTLFKAVDSLGVIGQQSIALWIFTAVLWSF
ncbi:hypothetical protein M758_2G098200, partial [Ceratodon purpureus]